MHTNPPQRLGRVVIGKIMRIKSLNCILFDRPM
jgi:hypothetical protein